MHLRFLFLVQLVYYFLPSIASSLPGCFSYRRDLSVKESRLGLALPIQFVIDTRSLVEEGKLKSDCSDLRFRLSSDQSWFTHWMESECNSTFTRIWVNLAFSSPVETIESATVPGSYGGEFSWAGEFQVSYAASTCPSPTTDTALSDAPYPDRRFLVADTSSSVRALHGAADSDHAHFDTTSVSHPPRTDTLFHRALSGGSSLSFADGGLDHRHPFGSSQFCGDSEAASPKFKNVRYCLSRYLTLYDGAVLPLTLVDFASSYLPPPFRDFTEMHGHVMRGSSSFTNTSLGTSTHRHPLSDVDVYGVVITPDTMYSRNFVLGSSSPKQTFSMVAHLNHLSSVPSYSPNASNLPDHWEVVFGLMDGTPNEEHSYFASNDLVFFATEEPPFGAFEKVPWMMGKGFLRGSPVTNYGPIRTTHSHSFEVGLNHKWEGPHQLADGGSELSVTHLHAHDYSTWRSDELANGGMDHFYRVHLAPMTYVRNRHREGIDYSSPEVQIRFSCSGAPWGSGCGPHGNCVAQDQCECHGAYATRTTTCDTPRCEDGNWLDENPCSGNGACSSTNATCECQENYEHHYGYCDDFKCEYGKWQDQNPCSGHGYCLPTNATCKCQVNFTCDNFMCEDGKWQHQSPCSAHGSCSSMSRACDCDGNYGNHYGFCDDFKCDDGKWQDESPCRGEGACSSTDSVCRFECSNSSQQQDPCDNPEGNQGELNNENSFGSEAVVAPSVVACVLFVIVVILLFVIVLMGLFLSRRSVGVSSESGVELKDKPLGVVQSVNAEEDVSLKEDDEGDL